MLTHIDNVASNGGYEIPASSILKMILDLPAPYKFRQLRPYVRSYAALLLQSRQRYQDADQNASRGVGAQAALFAHSLGSVISLFIVTPSFFDAFPHGRVQISAHMGPGLCSL